MIAHQNTSISAGSAAAAAILAQTAWRDALTGHSSGAWTVEDEFDSSGGTVHWVVVKCSTSISGVGSDFRVCIGRIVATGVMGACVGEAYNSTTKTLSVFAPLNSSTSYILADGSFGGGSSSTTATYVLGTSLPTSAGQPIMPSIGAAATERLVTCVEKEYAILHINGTSQYVGALTDLIIPKTGLVATPAIACANLFDTNPVSFGSITRHPIAAADAPMSIYYPHSLIPLWNSSYATLTSIQGLALLTAIYGYGDRYQNDRVAAQELAAVMYAASYNGTANNRGDKTGALRGKFKGIRMTSGPVGANAYDNIVVDDKKHVVGGVYSSLSSYQNFVAPYNVGAIAKAMMAFDTGIAV